MTTYDRELIAQMLTAILLGETGRFTQDSIAEQVGLLIEAHNRDAAGVHTDSDDLEQSIARLREAVRNEAYDSVFADEERVTVRADDLERVLRVAERYQWMVGNVVGMKCTANRKMVETADIWVARPTLDAAINALRGDV